MTVRVVLVDDQPLVRAGLRVILRAADGFEIVGECEDGEAALALIPRVRPDVVIMDLRMKGLGGIETIRRLRAGFDAAGEPDGSDAPPVLALTTFDDDTALSGALRAGAAGFQLKDAPAEELIRAVRVVAAGGACLDPSVTARVLAAYRANPPVADSPALLALSARERDVMSLLARGATNDEIADALVIGEGTVKTHIHRIFEKLSLRDRAAAIVFAFDHGLVRPRQEPGV